MAALDPQSDLVQLASLVVDALEIGTGKAEHDGNFDEYRGVLFSDHGVSEPYLVHEVGPFGELESLLDAIIQVPLGNGGDTPEALGDAIRHCRLLAKQLGPMSFLVLTDAPPHPVEECPESIDFDSEMRGLLEEGSACFVADDWQDGLRHVWAPYEGSKNFRRAGLTNLLPSIEPVPDSLTEWAKVPWTSSLPIGAPSAGPRWHPSSS